MQKSFNDVVILSKGGVLVPAISIKSQLQGDGREFLSLLYADPATGPGLVLAGATRKVGSVELNVPPLAKGQAYGWTGLVVSEEELSAHTAAVIAGEKPPAIDIDEDEMPGVHGLPSQADETDEDKDARLANLAHQNPVAFRKGTGQEPPTPIAKVSDGSGTGRYGDEGHWTGKGDGTGYPDGAHGLAPADSGGGAQTSEPAKTDGEQDGTE